MAEPQEILQVAVGQLDKRLGAVEQNLLELRTELQQLRTELRGEIAQLRTELRTEIAQVRTDLGGEIAQVRSGVQGEITLLRTEIAQLRSDLYSEIKTGFRLTITAMIALFGVAVPVWMWILNLILTSR